MQSGAIMWKTIPFFRLCSNSTQHLFYVRVGNIQQTRQFTAVLKSNCVINVGNHHRNVASPKSCALTATGLSSGNNFKLVSRKFSSSEDKKRDSDGENKLKSTLSKSFPKATNIIVEDISENAQAVVSESKAKLLKVKPKELTSYLGSLVSESSSTSKLTGVGSPSYTPGYMSYSTSIDCPFFLDYVSSEGPSAHTKSYPQYDMDGAGKFLNLNNDEAFDDTIVITNRKPSNAKIPEEKDLIDSEFDIETELTEDIPEPHETDIIYPAPQTSSNHVSSAAQSVRDINKNNLPHNTVQSNGKKQRKLKNAEREAIAKVKRDQMERLAKEVSLNKSLLAYLDMCVFGGQLNRGLLTLNYYRNKSKRRPSHPKVSKVESFNCLLHGFAAKGNLMKVNEIFKSILEDELKPTIQSYAAILECLGRLPPTSANKHKIKAQIDSLEKDGFSLNDVFSKAVFAGDQKQVILQAIKRYDPNFVPNFDRPSMEYDCQLLKNLYNQSTNSNNLVSPAEGLVSVDLLRQMADKQLNMELKGTITIKSVEQKDDLENLPLYRKLLQETEEKWAIAIKDSISKNLVTLMNQGVKRLGKKTIGLYPFLNVLQPDDYVDIILQEIRKLAEGSETYSPTVSQLYRELGSKVLARHQVIYKKEKGILDKVYNLYQDYIQWYLDPSAEGKSGILNSRQKWQDLMYNAGNWGPDVDVAEKAWPVSVQSSVGRFLYGLIMRDIKIDAQIMKLNSRSDHMVPAFYSIFRMQGVSLKEEIKPHPALVKLFQAASRDELTFEATLVPMICPPLPWCSVRTGGYLLTPAKIVRLPFQAHQQKVLLDNCASPKLFPSLDSLNQLGAVPWKINHKVLDTVIEVFNNKGNDDLGIPPPPSECPLPPPIDVNMTRQEKIKVHKTRLALKRRKAEMYSLWCDALYRLSLANHFRNDIFWFPHNMDFRGRVYPCPPHLNHLGADMARSILVFAKGKPLGHKGLDWLKIHLINLTGLKKRDSIECRLNYANEILDDILDSADNPLKGRRWWTESEEPWQTLACCIEVANAIRSGDPESYVSHFPVHQDGSCNGLQHYAALGRDKAGAESVNLSPSEVPQDVYSSIASRVENLRQQDAMKGVKIAQVLEGFIKRKVIKQTVMTTVYGVTKFGARLQIAKQLKDIPDFPKEHLWAASLYLVGRTFDSLQEMFTSTKEIQDWFTECARLISQICGQNVEWVTPLGLPVVQPYSRANKRPYESFDPSNLTETSIFDAFERPNVMKQKNAFPPNFIHSLDSSHMMLTSLYSEQSGITFVSVHDCYWTHPCSVEIMNRICREQFVALHSEPILEDLSKFMVQKYSYQESEFFRDGSVVDAMKRRLNQLLTEVPAKGSFDLKKVLESTYFFS